MTRVLVIDSNKCPLAPCKESRARRLLHATRARIFRYHPFTIILQYQVCREVPSVELKIDPGSKTTGLAVIANHFKTGKVCIFQMNLEHRGESIRLGLQKRANLRRHRRNRKTRYRKQRFDNRKRDKGWLPPSLMHRVHGTITWVRRLSRYLPLSGISVEASRFDIQKMYNPEISGIEYQRGTLQGYEVREYLLEKWGRECVYCRVSGVPLQVEHLVPKSRGGTDKVSNLTISCRPCNTKKGTKTFVEFGFSQLGDIACRTYRDASCMNATRTRILAGLRAFGLPVMVYPGSLTKMNRINQGYPKDHWIDAACVGESGSCVTLEGFDFLFVKSIGHGNRQMVLVDKYGFPRSGPKDRSRDCFGYQTGDIVRVAMPTGKNKGLHSGTVICRKKGNFDVKTKNGKKGSMSYKYFTLIQKADGYRYDIRRSV